MRMYWITMEGLANLARKGELDRVILEPARPLPEKQKPKPSTKRKRKP